MKCKYCEKEALYNFNVVTDTYVKDLLSCDDHVFLATFTQQNIIMWLKQRKYENI